MKKIITTLLAFVMLFTVVSCAKEKPKTQGTSKPETPGQEKRWDKREFDFEGYEFIILSKESSGNIKSWDGADIDCDEPTGNEVLDEVYYRNQLIEQTYHCKIVWVDGVNIATIKNTVSSGSEQDGAMISWEIKPTFNTLVDAGLLLNLNDPGMVNLDLTQPWYSQTIQRDTEVNGTLFFVNGDMLFTDETAMWVTLFNKELAKQYIEDVDGISVYDAVRSGDWTIDMLMKYAAAATGEVDGDDKATYKDRWGYIGEAPNVAALVTAAGYRYASITASGDVVSNVFNADFQNVFKKCAETVDKSFCLLASDISNMSDYWTLHDSIFQEGRALFMITGMNRALGFREMETDFGILPLPKLNKDQADYHTWTTYRTNVVSIPYTCENMERTSAIMEALFEESSYGLRTAYIDKAVKYQTTRDDDSIDMLDIIIASTVYDIGVVYDFGETYSSLNTLVQRRSIGSLASTLKKAQSKTSLDITSFNDMIKKYQS